MITAELTYTEIINANSTIRLLRDDIYHIVWKDGADIEIADIDELTIAFDDLTEGRMVKVISQMGKYVNITPQARDYAAKQSPQLTALAYVITGLGQRLVLRFYIRMRKNKNPTKVFDSFDAALKWLER